MPGSPRHCVSSAPEEFRKSMGVIPPGGGGELGALVSEDSSDWERGGKQELLKLLYHFTFGMCKGCAGHVGELVTGVLPHF